MIFVLDVGNTNTVLGVFENDELVYQWRIATDRYKTEDEYGMLIKSLFDHNEIEINDVKGVIISSVVPPIMYALERMCEIYFHVKPLIVGQSSVNLGLKMAYPNPHEIGADRVVNAVGAIREYGAPLIIIDFGTATTYCFVNEDKEYEGGAISPGINIATEALYAKAAKLPRIEITKPSEVVGTSTVGAMQTGLYYGYVGQVNEIVSRMKTKAKQAPKVVATGGLASLIAKESPAIDIVDPYLTLKGLYCIYKRNENNKGDR
ncbi:type III pantothenate kinase [Salirhabdus salicampi]|uniref:type III pantothenate kinase n=1 Tax=Salirhabdus salicampi TaxID=476102 RepID=UPI0020C5AFD5|nr:type III pantothenate kinase [Salirhabdus salicampi]MCP8618191.1 type III pantothenate kinase [Salirhabdus salicampi]